MTKPSLVIPGRGFIVSIPSGKFKPVTNNQSDIVKKNKLENRTSEVDQNIVRDRKPLTGTVQIASEGEVIPIVFGNQRVSTRMIWWGNYDVDLKTIDFAVRVCANEISDITKIWNMSKAGRLIYDTGLDGKGSLEKYVDGWRIYKGTLDQTADPRIASISGKNENTPAYTGLAYIVFLGYKLDMTQGKIPQFDVFVLGKKPVINYEVDFEADVTSGESPLTVNFTNLSDCAKNYSWDFGDGDGSILANPQHIYDEVGLYTVSLTGSYYIDVTETKMDYIEVLPPDTYEQIYYGSKSLVGGILPKTLITDTDDNVRFYDNRGTSPNIYRQRTFDKSINLVPPSYGFTLIESSSVYPYFLQKEEEVVIYKGGNSIYKLNGALWTNLNAPTQTDAYLCIAFDDQVWITKRSNNLFTIYKYDGVSSWILKHNYTGPVGDPIEAMIIYQDELFVSGGFHFLRYSIPLDITLQYTTSIRFDVFFIGGDGKLYAFNDNLRKVYLWNNISFTFTQIGSDLNYIYQNDGFFAWFKDKLHIAVSNKIFRWDDTDWTELTPILPTPLSQYFTGLTVSQKRLFAGIYGYTFYLTTVGEP